MALPRSWMLDWHAYLDDFTPTRRIYYGFPLFAAGVTAAVRPPLRPADLGLAVERRRRTLQKATVAAEATGMRADVGRGRLEGLYPDRAMILREISALSQRTEPPGHLHAGLVPAARWAACGGWKRRAARPRGTARFGGGSAASGRPVHP